MQARQTIGFGYLGNKYWKEITREERYFCAELYQSIKGREQEFVAWLNARLDRPLTPSQRKADWEVAFEVCFYRDILASKQKAVRPSGYPPKRTFDLCLFSETLVIVIEAKVGTDLQSEQASSIAKDKQRIGDFLRSLDVAVVPEIRFVGLFPKRPNSSRDEGLFNGIITWEDLMTFDDRTSLRRAAIVGAQHAAPLHGGRRG